MQGGPGRALWAIAALVAVPAGALAAQGPALQDNGAETHWPINPETAPRPLAHAVRVREPILVDGKLDEAAWRHAVPLSTFVQSQPRAGYPASERTVARIVYDDHALYVGAMCYDSRPDALTVLSLEQDFPGASTRDSDIFGVVLDPFLDRQNSYIFLVNPRGAYRDGQTFNDSRQEDFAWRALTRIETVVTDSGWSVEMEIPWTTLRFDPTQDKQLWGINLLRRVRRKNEDAYWAPLDRKDPLHRMSKAGTLDGLEGIHAGRNLIVKPFVVAADQSGANAPPPGAPSSALADVHPLGLNAQVDAGADVKYGVTSGLALDLTYRTDFSQADVDQEQVNLTRFPLFFPEQREFFVENSGSFILGDVSERNYRTGSSLREFTLFHSRRIGLTSDGRAVPVFGGARLTGRTQGLELGLLEMQTRSLDTLPAENFAVLRARRNLGASDVGFMMVNRQETNAPLSNRFNRSYGLDANLHVFRNLILNSYLAKTDETGASGDRVATRIAAGWRDRVWDMSAFFKRVGGAFDPGVGFIQRTGIRDVYATFGAHPRPHLSHVQEINPYVEAESITDSTSALQTRTGNLGFGVQFLDGSTLDLRATNRFEHLDRPFTVSGVTIPAADYEFNEGSISYGSSKGRPFSADVTLSGGGYFGGTRRSLSAEASWRADYHVTFEASAAHNAVDVPQGHFTADVSGGRMRLAYSTRLFGSAFVQYNGQTDQLVTNIRVNWIYAPLSDVFLVYSERRGRKDPADPVSVLDRVVTVKVSRALAF